MSVHHVIGGGTVFHVRPHLALSAPAYGTLARTIARHLREAGEEARLHLTRMADPRSVLETNDDVARLLDAIVADRSAKIVFLTAALVDYRGIVGDDVGKNASRLRTAEGERTMRLVPAEKCVGRVRRERKDIFLVACKTTAGASADEQYLAALRLLKTSSCNLVLANDVHTRRSMVVTPEQARYYETTDRARAVRGLVEMALARSRGTFTRSTVLPGEPVPWSSPLVPSSLRAVVDHCIARGAYKPFLGSTVGHFALRLDDRRMLTTRRKTDFNRLHEVGLVLVETEGHDRVVAHGSRPSVGGQSQRIVFREHPEHDCIVHFHCPMRPGISDVSVRPQWALECGSHECGENTSRGLAPIADAPGIEAVMLDQHGPNIVFHRSIDPMTVIAVIESRFDLGGRTDGVAPGVAARTAGAASAADD
jgi:DNA / pantothenate metabolism flavoprotein/Class II Aldolase and Adducin N-terminal domain